MIPRSYLFVPGDQPAMLEKAHRRGADALIADLEDAVAPAAKDEARRTVADWLDGGVPEGGEVWVRVNNLLDVLEADVGATVKPGVAGLVVPKVAGAEELHMLDRRIERAEVAVGIERGTVRLIPFVETATALVSVLDLARCPRVDRLCLGEMDLGAELGIVPSPDDQEWLPYRMQLVAVSTAAGIGPPIGPVAADFRDLDALRRSSESLRRMGIQGRLAIHPAQVPVINEAFTPSSAEIGQARRLLDLFEESLERGEGVCVDDEGRMVDEAVVRIARRTLGLAAAAGRSDRE